MTSDIRFINYVTRGTSGVSGNLGAIAHFNDNRPGNVWTGSTWDGGATISHHPEPAPSPCGTSLIRRVVKVGSAGRRPIHRTRGIGRLRLSSLPVTIEAEPHRDERPDVHGSADSA